MSDNSFRRSKVLCSQCQLPLDGGKNNSGSVRCPRCNTRSEVDSSCATSCISCQEKVVSIDITNNSQEKSSEISTRNVEKNDHGSCHSSEQSSDERERSLLIKAWKLLKRGLFQV